MLCVRCPSLSFSLSLAFEAFEISKLREKENKLQAKKKKVSCVDGILMNYSNVEWKGWRRTECEEEEKIIKNE